MDILVLGIKITVQLMLGRMSTAVGAFVNYASGAPQRFVEDVLFCALVALVFMLRRYILKKIKQVLYMCAALLEECWELLRIGRTQAREVSVSPAEGAGPLNLQTLCLAVLLENITRFYPLLADVLREEQNADLLELPFHRVMMACAEAQKLLLKESSDSVQVQGAETENILEASEETVNQADQEMPDDLVKMDCPEEKVQLLSEEAAKWTEGAQE